MNGTGRVARKSVRLKKWFLYMFHCVNVKNDTGERRWRVNINDFSNKWIKKRREGVLRSLELVSLIRAFFLPNGGSAGLRRNAALFGISGRIAYHAERRQIKTRPMSATYGRDAWNSKITNGWTGKKTGVERNRIGETLWCIGNE